MNPTQTSGQAQTTAYNAQTMTNDQAYQDYESSTAYQRGTADMEKAGINPLIAYQGASASAPTTSTQTAIQAQTAQTEAEAARTNATANAIGAGTSALSSLLLLPLFFMGL